MLALRHDFPTGDVRVVGRYCRAAGGRTDADEDVVGGDHKPEFDHGGAEQGWTMDRLGGASEHREPNRDSTSDGWIVGEDAAGT